MLRHTFTGFSTGRPVSVAVATVAAILLLFSFTGCKRSKKYVIPPLPSVNVEAPAGVQEGIFEITYTVSDPYSNPVDATVEFTTDNAAFVECTRAPGGMPVTDLATSPAGLIYTFRWNSVADSVGLSLPVDTVRIRITPYQQDIFGQQIAGYAGTSSEFTVDNSTGNTPPTVAIVTSPQDIQTGDVSTWYTITDAETDTGYVEVMYKVGIGDWQPATLVSGTGGTVEGNLVVNVSCPIPPAQRNVVWDSAADLGPVYAHEIWLRIIGHDARTGSPADTTVFRVDNTLAPVPPIVTFITPASPSRGLVTLEYDISDNNAETANIVFELSLDGGTTWQLPSMVYSDIGRRVGNIILDVPCLPSPETHYIIWNSAMDVGFAANYGVRFRAKPDSSVQGTWAQSALFAVDNSSPAGGPQAVITADRLSVQSSDPIAFSAMSSTGSPTTFLWDFGDGSYSSATEPVHTYDTGAGDFVVTLTVTDAAGLSDSANEQIKVTEPITEYRSELEPYRDPAETRTLLEELADAYPDIMTIYTIGYSVQGREIYAVKISDNVHVDEDEPSVHFDSEHHAREVMTPEVLIDIAEQLVWNYSTSSEVQGWIDDYEIYLIPCVNPDSSVAVFATDWSIRKNANGVDLNRNYPTDWGNNAGSSSDPSDTTYRGPYPASEPEVQTMMAQVLRTRPAAGITFHTYSNIVLYPYCSPGLSQTSQEGYIQQFAEDIAGSMSKDIDGDPYIAAHTLWYDASGVTPDWHYCDVGTFCILVEVGNNFGGLLAFHPDYGTWHDPQVEGVRGGIAELLRYVGRGAICGHVTDFDTGEPLEADISISAFINLNSEIRRSEPEFGRYYWLWEDGDYGVTFTHEGYAPQTHNITVAGVPCVLDVQLVKNATGNHKPTASFTASMTKFDVGTTIFFDAGASTDEDGDILTYYWNFGDNQTSSLVAPTHTFDRTGTHRVVLRVIDGNGGEHETWSLVHVMPASEAPHVTLLPVTGTWTRDVYVSYGLSILNPSDCSIAVEYTYDGLVWYPATIAGADEGWIDLNTVSSIATTSELADHYFLWDSLTDLGAAGTTIVALKVTPYVPGRIYGDPAVSNSFAVDNTPSNSPPSVSLSVQSPPLSNNVVFNGTISDPDYESCSLTIEYSVTTGTTWLPVTLTYCDEGIIAGNVIHGLAAAPAGTPYIFEWDSRTDLGIVAVTDAWMRVTPNDSETDGAPAMVTGLLINNVGLLINSPLESQVIDTSCDIEWIWDSTAGGPEGDLVYEIDYARGAGNIYFYNDFRIRPDNDWEYTGDSFWDRDSETVMLDRAAGGAGGLWYAGDITATEWYCSFRFRITGGARARGFYFSFYSQPTTAQYPSSGYTIEFDANYNSTVDPLDAYHIALLDSAGTHLCYTVNNDFSDGSWHTAEVYYKNGLLLIDLDGSNVLGYWIETPDMSNLRFGFGGRHHDGRTYHVDDVFLSDHRPVWTTLVDVSDSMGTSGGIGSYLWDASMVSSGTGYIVRIRAGYGGGYSSYAYSGPFSVEHSGPPSVSLTDPPADNKYEVPLSFTLSDPTDDICSVRLRYSLNGGTDWNDATVKSASAGEIDVNFVRELASGSTYALVWDAWHDLGENAEPSVRLELTPSDILTGTESETVDFGVDNTGHPGELTGFAADVQNDNVILTWINPSTPSLHKIVIVRRDDRYPTDPGDGTVVFDSEDTGYYFDNMNLNGPAPFIRQDTFIDFAWGSGSPDGSIPDNEFSAVWTGAVDIMTAGPFNFHTVSEDGVRLYVDGDLIIDRWVSRAVSEYCGYKKLGVGRHTLVLEYFHNQGNSEAHLYLTGPGLTRTVVPLAPGQPTTFTDYSVSTGNTYYYTGFTYTPGASCSTGAASARASASP